MKKTIMTLAAVVLASGMTFAKIRPTDQSGINQFETPIADSVEFEGVKTTIGGGFALPFSALSHSNTLGAYNKNNAQTLTPLTNNFSLSQANLFLNTVLADGVTLNMSLYLASRHHHETWVKGGFIQFDKLPFLKCDLTDKIMSFTSLKVGQMDVNYGDAHFRRSDGGHALYNPFMENYIMDEFATEIGGEADFHYNGLLGVLSVTNGQLNPNQTTIDKVANPSSNGLNNPSFIGKLGYDKQLTDQLRVRLTGSVYYTAGAYSNTLFGGDRTGSNYSGVMYNVKPGDTTPFNGRYNPGLTDKLTTSMVNLFVKYKPMEWLAVESFSTYEMAKGRNTKEAVERSATQVASDLVFRFGKDENFFVGARYNKVDADVAGSAAVAAVAAVAAKNGTPIDATDLTKGFSTLGTPAVAAKAAIPAGAAYAISIDRIAFSAGWFLTKNVMAKVEYVKQNYNGFLVGDMNNGAKFSGLTAQAVIGF